MTHEMCVQADEARHYLFLIIIRSIIACACD